MPGPMDELIAALKEGKGLAGLDDAFVREKVERAFASDARIARKLASSRDFAQFSRSKEYEALRKAVRKELRAVYGVFQDGAAQSGGREALLSRYEASRDDALLDELMRTHTSTRERLPHFPYVYAQLAARIPAPMTLLDLGCGLNPLSYREMARAGWSPHVIASDISASDMAFLARCFAAAGIPGETLALDLTREEDLARLSTLSGDVTLLLKLLDSLEEAQRHVSYKVLGAIPSPWVVASFPTRSLGGARRISAKGRTWFERLLGRLGFSWETFEVENELFYVCKRTGVVAEEKVRRAHKEQSSRSPAVAWPREVREN